MTAVRQRQSLNAMEMCETIAAAILADYGITMSPAAILTAFPGGDVHHVYEMYDVYVLKVVMGEDGSYRPLSAVERATLRAWLTEHQ